MSNTKSENAAQPMRVVPDPNSEPTEEDRLRADWEQKKAEREKKTGKKKPVPVVEVPSSPLAVQPLEEATIQQLYDLDREKKAHLQK